MRLGGVGMIDCHSHILPGMDDGSRSTEESIQMLRMEHEQGVSAVILTPHYYAEQESIESFLHRRAACYLKLSSRMQQLTSAGEQLPGIHTGAEVRYFPRMALTEDIEKLCIQGTNHMLIEMPFDTWSEGVFRDLEILETSGIRPVIAHIERFIKFQKHTENIKHLLEMELLIQSNTSFFTERVSRRTAIRMLKNGMIDLIATDCHRAKGGRVPDMAQALEYIEKKLGKAAAELLRENGWRLLK